ncbi:unnamed protein product [Pleuronectes platessa]|uniref:Cyclin-like domain-containing protein n=1 Tax=Pleuronectes platessa TaxID=8262 RepID=A0A9N7VIG4_PLEPL|nr:unnamed protein product [Pleuronectes platessa]
MWTTAEPSKKKKKRFPVRRLPHFRSVGAQCPSECRRAMAACRGSSSKWFFTREQLENTPSRRGGVEPDRELSYRQQAANLIQDMGQRLNVSQLTINTAIVYMHRFYMHHSFTKFHRNIISPTTLFLAAKVEEQPRKLEHVIKVSHACLNPQEPPLDTKSNAYLQQAQELVLLESIVLQTLGFEITIDHPHTDVVKCSQLVRASKDLAQTSYFMATNSLHLTTFCLQYKPTVIACVCIHLACKWSNWEIPVSTDGKHWWEYVDSSVTLELLDELTHEFLQILEKTPSRLKRIRNWRATQAAKKPKIFPCLRVLPCPWTHWPAPIILLATEPKGAGGAGKHHIPSQSSYPPPQPSPAPKLSLDKYREKLAAEQAVSGQKRRQEQHGGAMDFDVRGEMSSSSSATYAPSSVSQVEHRKHSHQTSHGGAGSTTASPLKIKVPSLTSGQEKRHHSEKRDKGLLKLRLAVPGSGSSQLDKSGQLIKDELKMKIKVSSSDCHSSSDEGINNSKSKHSSPLVSKEKHRGGDHSVHRHHKHSHPHTHSGNGRGGPEGPGGGAGLLRGTPGPIGMEGTTLAPPGSTMRKRAHPEVGHNHHPPSSSSTSCSKVSKISKGGTGAAGGLRTSQQYPPPSESPHEKKKKLYHDYSGLELLSSD